jgi:hypothetical protein
VLKPGDTAPPFDLPCAAGDRARRLRLSQMILRWSCPIEKV